ncbi:hypothetical protein TPA0909_39110 [Streptomyces albus]|nr:hypothetical protein TPA0909_39110 [Streptomyces albus]
MALGIGGMALGRGRGKGQGMPGADGKRGGSRRARCVLPGTSDAPAAGPPESGRPDRPA